MSGDRPAAFLDRDGTLIRTIVTVGKPIPGPTSVALLDGAKEACQRLRDMGFAVVMVTNQPDVARDLISRDAVEAVNEYVTDLLDLDLSLCCVHDDVDNCVCRKPLPGMLYEASSRLGLRLDRRSVMIGDRWRDIDAGAAAGVTTVLIDRGYGELLRRAADHIAPNIASAVRWVDANLRQVLI